MDVSLKYTLGPAKVMRSPDCSTIVFITGSERAVVLIFLVPLRVLAMPGRSRDRLVQRIIDPDTIFFPSDCAGRSCGSVFTSNFAFGDHLIKCYLLGTAGYPAG